MRDSGVPRLSRFTHFIDIGNGLTAVYDSAVLAVYVIESDVADWMQSLRSFESTSNEIQTGSQGDSFLTKHADLIEELTRLGVINRDDEAVLDALRSELSRPRFAILYLLLTDNCNLACGYCYVKALIPQKRQPNNMSWETARTALERFSHQLESFELREMENPQVILHGGEPFLNWAVLSRTLQYVHSCIENGTLPPATAVNINTNGTMITDEAAEFISQFPFVSLAVSVDGPAEIHDSLRRDVGGRGSFDNSIHGVHTLLRMGIKVGISCTIAPHYAHRASEILLWLHNEFPGVPIGFNVLINSSKMSVADRRAYTTTLAEQMVTSLNLARSEGIYEDTLMRRVDAFSSGSFRFNDCGACGQQTVVSPEGWIGVCHAYTGTKKYFLPPDTQATPQEHPYWQEWSRRSPVNIEECHRCIAFGSCGGGCPHSAEMVNGSIWRPDDIYCGFSRAIVESFVRDVAVRVAQTNCKETSHAQ